MITSLFAGILTLLFFKITIETIKARKKNQISLGPGESNEILKFTSAHSNFIEYTPLFLILFFLVESYHKSFLHISLYVVGSLFVLGRLLHFKGLTASTMNFKMRKTGMHLSLWPILLLAVSNIILFFSSYL